MKTTVDEVKALVWALADELNTNLLKPIIKPDQQQKTLKNISLVRYRGKKERLCIRPSEFGFYIAPSQRSLVDRMVPFLQTLIGTECHGYYQPNFREPYWYVENFEVVREAAYFFAEIPYPSALEGFQSKRFCDLLQDFDKKLEKACEDSSINRQSRLAQAPRMPAQELVTSKVYIRNPDVVAEALFRANGICEVCHQPAPFLKKLDSTPYLEVHHIERLSDGGADVLENVLALCPNCHRREHYGVS